MLLLHILLNHTADILKKLARWIDGCGEIPICVYPFKLLDILTKGYNSLLPFDMSQGGGQKRQAFHRDSQDNRKKLA